MSSYLKSILSHYDIRVGNIGNITFDNMLNKIDNFFDKENGKKLPYRTEIRNLNVNRNQVQHHADEPTDNSMEKWRVFTRSFLIKVLKEYFNKDFDDLSYSDLIEDRNLSSLIENAESSLSEEKWERAILFSTVAFKLSSTAISNFLSKDYRVKSFDFHPELLEACGTSSYCKNTLKKLFDEIYKKIMDVEYGSVILSTGINLTEYKKLKEIIAPVGISEGGDIYVYRKGKSYTKEQAFWLCNFVIDCIINWQSLGLNPAFKQKKGLALNTIVTQLNN